jgi:hypothetical protein
MCVINTISTMRLIIFYLKFKYGALNNGHGIQIIKLYAFKQYIYIDIL